MGSHSELTNLAKASSGSCTGLLNSRGRSKPSVADSGLSLHPMSSCHHKSIIGIVTHGLPGAGSQVGVGIQEVGSDNHVSEVVGVIPTPSQVDPNQTSPQGLGAGEGKTAPREPVGTPSSGLLKAGLAGDAASSSPESWVYTSHQFLATSVSELRIAW